MEEADNAIRDRMGVRDLQELHRRFYEIFEEAFTERAREKCTINVHTFYHLLESRKRTGRPLWETSAEPFESVYALLTRCFQVGTNNTPKQVLQQFYLREW